VTKIREWLPGRPDDWRVHLMFADFLKATGQAGPKPDLPLISQAVDMYKSALAIIPPGQEWVAQPSLGHAYQVSGRFDEAAQAYLAALKSKPDNIQSLNNLAYMYASDMNKPAEGIAYAERAMALAPDNPQVLDTYGWALAKNGDLAKAEQVLSRAVQLAQGLDASIQYHLGMVYEQTSRPAEALREYEAALDAVGDHSEDPMHKVLTEALGRVRPKATSETVQ
jgi:tetratricopeptide (TPR) repeat protein